MSQVNFYEIPAKNPKKILKFYSQVFDWKMEDWGKDYWGINSGRGKNEGIKGAIYLSEKMKTVVNTIGVPDMQEYIDRIKKYGGKVMGKPHNMGEWGWHVYFKDPEGTMLGISGPMKKN